MKPCKELQQKNGPDSLCLSFVLEVTTSQEEDNEEGCLFSMKQNNERNKMTNLHQHVNSDNTFALCPCISCEGTQVVKVPII